MAFKLKPKKQTLTLCSNHSLLPQWEKSNSLVPSSPKTHRGTFDSLELCSTKTWTRKGTLNIFFASSPEWNRIKISSQSIPLLPMVCYQHRFIILGLLKDHQHLQDFLSCKKLCTVTLKPQQNILFSFSTWALTVHLLLALLSFLNHHSFWKLYVDLVSHPVLRKLLPPLALPGQLLSWKRRSLLARVLNDLEGSSQTQANKASAFSFQGTATPFSREQNPR